MCDHPDISLGASRAHVREILEREGYVVLATGDLVGIPCI